MSNLLDKKIAIIGAGKMGGALAEGLVAAQAVRPSDITLFDAYAPAAKSIADRIGASVSPSTPLAVTGAEIILFAVKPAVLPKILEEVGPAITNAQLVISIAAGVRLEKIEGLLPVGVPVVRAMPNTAALVGQAATAIVAGKSAGEEHIRWALHIFNAVGAAVTVEERLIDAVTGLSGSGPAYVYTVIEALIDGGVKEGLPRDMARQLAAQTVYGAAKMVLVTGEHPMKLKDDVTTPGGTTIAGLAELERSGLRIALINAVEAATKRSKELS